MSSRKTIDPSGFSCPLPLSDHPLVLMAHGGGGRLMNQLIEKMLGPALSSPLLDQRHDGAVFEAGNARLALTTDSYVVRPLFFPGGDIGKLAVNGTVNDLAMCGARHLYLSLGLILEEGLPMDTLWRVVQSIRDTAAAAGVQIVTGDTKVVDRGKGDGIYINTSGVGVVANSVSVLPANVRPGDALVLSGDLGRHGVAIMNAREELGLESDIETDSQPLAGLVRQLLDAEVEIRCLRDLTRGGLASALVEIAESTGLHLEIDESRIAVREDVRGACEILGLDPIYIANEGRFVAFVSAASARTAVDVLTAGQQEGGAAVIGTVSESGPPGVTLKSRIGVDRIVDMLSGEQLPRIC